MSMSRTVPRTQTKPKHKQTNSILSHPYLNAIAMAISSEITHWIPWNMHDAIMQGAHNTIPEMALGFPNGNTALTRVSTGFMHAACKLQAAEIDSSTVFAC